MKRISGLLVVALTLMLGLVTAPAQASSGVDDRSLEAFIFGKVNQERVVANVPALKSLPHLDAVAYNWSKQMAIDKKLYHNPNVGNEIPKNWSGWGENVAYVMGHGSKTGAVMHRNWMDSPGHRANILASTYTHVGVGFYTDKKGKTWATQVFATFNSAPAASPKPPAPAPNKLPAAAPIKSAKISGVKKATYTVPTRGSKALTVKLSAPGHLQIRSGGKWKNKTAIVEGKHRIAIPASIRNGKKLRYRVYIPATSKHKAKASPSILIHAKKKTTLTGMKGGTHKIKASTLHKDKIKLSNMGYFQKSVKGKWKTIKELPAGTNIIKMKAAKKRGTRKVYRVIIKSSSNKIGVAKKVALRST